MLVVVEIIDKISMTLVFNCVCKRLVDVQRPGGRCEGGSLVAGR